jgi:hypothetical protein
MQITAGAGSSPEEGNNFSQKRGYFFKLKISYAVNTLVTYTNKRLRLKKAKIPKEMTKDMQK